MLILRLDQSLVRSGIEYGKIILKKLVQHGTTKIIPELLLSRTFTEIISGKLKRRKDIAVATN